MSFPLYLCRDERDVCNRPHHFMDQSGKCSRRGDGVHCFGALVIHVMNESGWSKHDASTAVHLLNRPSQLIGANTFLTKTKKKRKAPGVSVSDARKKSCQPTAADWSTDGGWQPTDSARWSNNTWAAVASQLATVHQQLLAIGLEPTAWGVYTAETRGKGTSLTHTLIGADVPGQHSVPLLG